VDASASKKLYTDTDKAAVVAGVTMDGEPLIDASAFLDRENIALMSDMLFGEKAYGIDLENMLQNYEDSAFGPDGEYWLGFELPEETDSVGEEAAQMVKDAQALLKSMSGVLMKSVKEHAEIDKEGAVISINSEDIKTTAVSIRVDNAGVMAVLRDMVEYLRTDKQVREFLNTYKDYLAAVLVESGVVYGDYDAEDLVTDFYDLLDDLEDDVLEDLEEELDDADFEAALTFHITKSGKELVGVEFVGEAFDEKVEASAFAGPSWEKLEEISIRVEDEYDTIRISYLVSTNDKKEYSAKLKLRENSTNVLVGEFAWDKEKGDFELELTDEWEDTMGAEGTLEVTSKATTIVLESVYDYYGEYDVGITAVIKPSDKMPSMPEYIDILEMTDEEVTALGDELEGAVQELLFLVMFL